MPPRLAGYDYRTPGTYFITLCAHERRALFGQVDGVVLVLSPLGLLAASTLPGTMVQIASVTLDALTIMPDHLHALVTLTGESRSAQPTLSHVVANAKASITREARRAALCATREEIWQRGFYDRVVRSDDELAALLEYMSTNPLRWTLARNQSIR